MLGKPSTSINSLDKVSVKSYVDNDVSKRSLVVETNSKRRHTFFHVNSKTDNPLGRFLSSSYLNLPTFTITNADSGSYSNHTSSWKLNFGALIRKYSNSTINQSESMQSLCFETLRKFIQNDQILDCINYLAKGNVPVDERDDNGTTLLMFASRTGKLTFVKELIKYGSDVNIQDQDGWTSLMYAAKEGFYDIAKELIENGSSLELRDIGGWTALLWATYKGHTQIVEFLVEKCADVNIHGNLHVSPLIWASGRGFTKIVEVLICKGAKVNFGDKYGTTSLTWASRKGYIDIVDLLLKAGANADATGMYCWTPLILATIGNYVDVVHLLLDHKPNVNTCDKDGYTPLNIACKEGYHEIVLALISAGAYINVPDRSGETNLIHAVKGGHRNVVEILLKKYVNVDLCGKDHKSPIYLAVEKQNVAMVKLFLNANPDLEIATKSGDTPLLRAVRLKNIEIIQLLLEKKAKVSPVDKNGDTVLHIAMRSRSKSIVELLLRNPKNSQLLYRPNKHGETPYNIDLNNEKPILGQIFGARRLNTNEDTENMLGYDLYSSALADFLSEPSLSMPITVGLFAKWGSGKSFLLEKLRDEMNNFARVWHQPIFEFSLFLFMIVAHLSIIVGVHIGAVTVNSIMCLSVTLFTFVGIYVIIITLWYFSKRLDCDLSAKIIRWLATNLLAAKLVFQIIFCHPPGYNQFNYVQPVRFYFTDQTRISSSVGGENTLVHMIGSLFEAVEKDYGRLSTRLYRAFKPKPVSDTFTQRWRKICCIPYFFLFELGLICIQIASILTILYFIHYDTFRMDNLSIQALFLAIIVILIAIILTNIGTWCKILSAVVFSHRRHLQQSLSQLEAIKSEGFVNILKHEVNLLTNMVKCLDSLRNRQSRLVVVVDGLDSCEQEKVLLMLDAVHVMFSDPKKPFIIILAIDPHIISKVVEMSSHRLFNESNISGYDYLHNLVHLPFYLQNSGLRKFKLAQKTSNSLKKSDFEDNTLVRSHSNRRLSTESSAFSSSEKLKMSVAKNGSKKLKLSESLTSSIGSNLHRLTGANDLTRMLLTDDYFSDVNPKSMRRLMNVIYVTGRLMKAFHIDFNWYRLASWINITEQWPYRTTWIILHFDMNEDSLDDSVSLKAIYDLVRPLIPATKEIEPLLELDRNEDKFDVFLTFHRSSLLASDLKIFLPFTINLDPYIKKVIKNQYQNMTDDEAVFVRQSRLSWNPFGVTTDHDKVSKRLKSSLKSMIPLYPVSIVPSELLSTKLSSLNIDGICNLLWKCDGLSSENVVCYTEIIKNHNINGRVLLHCDLNELKSVLNMNFGDWELFKMMIVSLKEYELTKISKKNETVSISDESKWKVSTNSEKKSNRNHSNKDLKNVQNSINIANNTTANSNRALNVNMHAVIEKQVTLEEQAICGALQTLNEEAFEDVQDEALVLEVTQTNTVLPKTEAQSISSEI